MFDKEKLNDAVCSLDDSELVALWNAVCDDMDTVYPMCELEVFVKFPTDFDELRETIDNFDGFDFDDDYFYYNRNGNIQSGLDVIDTDEIVGTLMEDGEIPMDVSGSVSCALEDAYIGEE